MNESLQNLEGKIEKVSQQTLALRQALNPLKPEEVLTIARLTDEVTKLSKGFDNLSQQLSQNQKEFRESVLRELKSSNDSTNLILVVLIPLVLNFLYTIWKDLRSEKKQKIVPNQANAAETKNRATD